MPDWQLFLSEVLNVDWWWWRLFPADIRQAVTRVSWRVYEMCFFFFRQDGIIS